MSGDNHFPAVVRLADRAPAMPRHGQPARNHSRGGVTMFVRPPVLKWRIT